MPRQLPHAVNVQRTNQESSEQTSSIVRPSTHSAILPVVFLSVLFALLVGVSTVLAQGRVPDTPDRPTGTAVFVGGVDLEWNDVTGADSYEVQLFKSGQWALLPGNGVEIAFYGAGAIISSLNPSDTLWFRVRAGNAHGSSDWSAFYQMASTSQSQRGRQPRPDNVAASGAPVISGTTEVGQTLTADTGGIEDGNGLDRVEFRLQWVSNSGGTDTIIADARDSTYTLMAADEGSTIKVRVDFTDRGGYSESLTSTATASVVPVGEGNIGGGSTQNSPATGAPTISGTAQVGETLTADTSGIADSDGLTNVSYSYQWISNDGSSDSDITEATRSSYTLVVADKDKTIKVRVSFTDGANNAETLTSATTEVVAGAPLTATFENIPGSHDGQTAFTLELTFSESPNLSFRTLKFHAFTVDDGTVKRAKRIEKGSNIRWNITVMPDSDADVTVTLPETTDCADSGAVCMGDGRKLSVPISATIAGPQQNSPATGTPIISGTEQVGETLSADTSGISDVNGLTGVQYSYQWVRNDGTTDSDISGATGSAYTVVDDDLGNTLKVRLSFTDDVGYAETLTSAATATVSALSTSEHTYVELSGGSFHMCGIATGGSIHCWGEGNKGQTDAPEGTYKTLASGSAHTCAIATDGSIDCWGWNTNGQSNPPTGTFKSIASHSRHSCAIAVDDTIACWGYSSFHQDASPAGTYKSMAIGWEHTCTIKTDDTVACWGLNDHGEGDLPAGTYKAITAGFVHTCAIKSDDSIVCSGMNHKGQTEAPTGSYVSISAGEYHTCAIATDGSIACWGDSSSGRTDAPEGTYQSISARDYHTCAIATDNTISCWGNNGDGQADSPSGTFKATALAYDHTCGIATDGTVKCWGWNFDARSDTPAGTYESAVMGRDHACAIATDDTVSCWGDNGFGQTDAPTGTYQHLAAGDDHTCAIATDDTIACWGYGGNRQTNAPAGTYQSIVSGYDHTCAIADDDILSCWGYNAYGQTNVPTGTYKAVTIGHDFTCAIAADDTISCWGYNEDGETKAPAGAYQSISTGKDHSCAVATDGSVACWGKNELGKLNAADGTFQSVTASEYHTCAIATDDTVTCWGYNKDGQADAPSGSYRSVSMGEFHTCAVATDNTVVCWGNDKGGRTDAPDGTYQSITVHTDHTVAIATDGTLVAWPSLPEGVTWVGGDQ